MLDDFQSIPDAGSLPLYHVVLRLARLSASAAAAADSAQQKMQRQTCARDELLKGGRECATSTCHDLRWQPRVDCKARRRFKFAAGLRLMLSARVSTFPPEHFLNSRSMPPIVWCAPQHKAATSGLTQATWTLLQPRPVPCQTCRPLFVLAHSARSLSQRVSLSLGACPLSFGARSLLSLGARQPSLVARQPESRPLSIL